MSPRRVRLPRVSVGILLLLSACGSNGASGTNNGDVWLYLAREDRPGLHQPKTERPLSEDQSVRLTRADPGLWIESVIEHDDWLPTMREDVRKAALPVRGIGGATAGTPSIRLRIDGEEVTSVRFTGQHVLLKLEAGEAVPERAHVSSLAMPSVRSPSGSARIAGRRFSGEGFAVWPDERLDVRVAPDEGGVLRFATCAERALLLEEGSPRMTFRVFADGDQLFEHLQEVPADGSFAWHAVPLPRGGAFTLTFEVSGHFAYTSFLSPTIGPARAPEPDATDSLESSAPPDIVVFLADTFRADNLAAYGSELELTPNVDAFAAQSLLFRRAWSTGASTLPAHASMFTGFFPRQCGILGHAQKLPEGIETIAEALSERGYRTGAITDSVIVSQAFGLDQGFEWFDEHKKNLGSTLFRARAFLDADDGRPTFLFVQTYRTHGPYEVSSATRRERGAELGIEDVRYKTTMDVLESLVPDTKHPERGVPGVEQTLQELRGLYRGGVVDLDRGFGRFLEDLRERGLADRAYVVFASDHGEAFGEHGRLFHTGKVFEEQVRIPLILSGPGIQAGVVDHAASLIDLVPTLAGLARIPADPRWPGKSLLELAEERPTFAFQCKSVPAESTVAVIEADRKLIGFETELEAGSPWAAFDLAQDPREEANLVGGPSWPREMARRYEERLEDLLAPLVETEAAHLDVEALESLDDMGYGGG